MPSPGSVSKVFPIPDALLRRYPGSFSVSSPESLYQVS
jgi:hypothetical protein